MTEPLDAARALASRVRACAEAHDGVTRLIRDGLRFDKYLVTTSCRSCRDPLCMIGCPVGSIRRKNTLEIIIEDNGPGVPPDILPFLFDPFVTTKTNGSGLGLALVAKIVGDHGGVIDCDSRPGRTRFRILLPVASGAFQTPADAEEGPST